MDLLIEAHHPSHLYVWRHLVARLRDEGREVLVASRDRNIMRHLTQSFFDGHSVLLTTVRRHNRLPASEFVERQIKVANRIRRHRPKVVASLMGVYTQSAWAFGTPNLVVTDSEFQHVARRIAHPFATRVLVPSCCRPGFPEHSRLTTHESYHELAYLHPDHFVPDPNIPKQLGLTPNRYSILRLSANNSLHDMGAKGIHADQLRSIRSRLELIGDVLIDDEAASDVKRASTHAFVPEQFHHLLAFARIVVSTGATTTSEAACLGVPAIYFCQLEIPGGLRTLNEQQSRYRLNRSVFSSDQLLPTIDQMLTETASAEVMIERRQKLLSEKQNFSEVLYEMVRSYL